MPTKIALSEPEENSVAKFANQILEDGITKSASDIHFEPYENHSRIRFRIDGILYEQAKVEKALTPRLNTRLKIMAGLNIAEKRLPQDGRFTFHNPQKQKYDCRISSCPTMFGEKIVIRILNSKNSVLSIEQLGLDIDQQKIFQEKIFAPQGMILVTGPTGSGKTVTLYTALNQLNSANKNISTAEDPVEIILPGINQVEINHKIGLTFASALKAFLRQDPDIIMLGEIRDLETAQIAIQAAHTGHLVLATLHTNNRAESINRLLNMGVKAYNIATSLTLIIAQRLVRKLCKHCLGQNLETGCTYCQDGYSGRLGIFELLPITKTISKLIFENASTLAIEKEAQLIGMETLKQIALKKAKLGLTNSAEINRVIE
ncbi:MAG: Flp pilus assembly complex ATPase component TadA [Gammaproteobacteria bacterium]|nr:Flp pilus assembly complex ATPase component TadA [Gammaproteobacteria bacterium]